MNENVKVTMSYIRFKVDSHALSSVIIALNNCGIYDIAVTKEDNEVTLLNGQRGVIFGTPTIFYNEDGEYNTSIYPVLYVDRRGYHYGPYFGPYFGNFVWL